VTLIEGKPLVLRVYVSTKSGSAPKVLSHASGTVLYERMEANRSRTTFPPLPSFNGAVQVLAGNQVSRANSNHSINFLIPGPHCTGELHFSIYVTDLSRLLIAQPLAKPVRVSARFQAMPQIRVHGVLVHYIGTWTNPVTLERFRLDLPAPSEDDLRNTLDIVGRLFPINGIAYDAPEVFSYDADVQNPGQTIDPSAALWSAIRELKNQSDPRLWIGLLPVGTRTTGGRGGGGVAVARSGSSFSMAQEMGHALGLEQHTPGCGAPNPDPLYPQYDPARPGSIGEFGFDTRTFEVHDPATTFDFMGYCPPKWTSPYTYAKLASAIRSRF